MTFGLFDFTTPPSDFTTKLRQRAFQIEELSFDREPAGKSPQRSVMGDHPVARHNQGNGIGAKRVAHGPCIPRPADLRRNPPVGAHAAEGNPQRGLPDFSLKRGTAGQIDGKIERAGPAREIAPHLPLSVPQHRAGRISRMAVARHPGPQRPFDGVAGRFCQHDCAHAVRRHGQTRPTPSCPEDSVRRQA